MKNKFGKLLAMAVCGILLAASVFSFIACNNITSLKVTFDDNYERSPAPYVVTVDYGDAIAEPASPIRDNYDFGGWYTRPAGGDKYVFASAVTENMTLYAHWTVKTDDGGDPGGDDDENPGVASAYQADYESKAEALEAANLTNEEICEEGFVLLKNENGALPLRTDAKISILGKNSVNMVYGGSGSSGGNSDNTVNLHTALQNVGFVTNAALLDFYDSPASGAGRTTSPVNLDDPAARTQNIGETPVSSYTDPVLESFKRFNDAAIVVISRIGGEGFDLPRTVGNAEGARDPDDHYLQLDQNETDLLRMAADNFGKIIVVINSGSPMELGFLDDPSHYAYQKKIVGAIWIGYPGGAGLNALGRILNGRVNPSGRLTDTYARNFKNDPTWHNFGNNLTKNGNRYHVGDTDTNYFYVDYEENIYVGYRYYETRYATDGEAWYNENVIYPFGYGLSYTAFDSELQSVSINFYDKIDLAVKVTNTGLIAGKEVIQIYVTPPYLAGSPEKSAKILAGFEKTSLLKPGESETMRILVDPYYFASYNYKGTKGFKGYELESGDYTFTLGKNAHDVSDTATYSLAAAIRYDYDLMTDMPVENRFDDVSDGIGDTLSRNSWAGTWPAAPTYAERGIDQRFIDKVKDPSHNNPVIDFVEFEPVDMPKFGVNTHLMLSDLLPDDLSGADGSPLVDYHDERWLDILQQCTVDDLKQLVSCGAYMTSQISNIAKPATKDVFGASKLNTNMSDTCFYAAQVVIASTWNADISHAFGVSVGNEALLCRESLDNQPYSGWYAPNVNIHRSPFGGRNFESYSEDALLSGKMAAEQIRGAQSKGVYCYVGRFALNEQETNRSINGLLTWATEQSMREIYFRPFEIVVKEGGTRAVMSSFNRIGTRWTGGDYRLLTEVLRDEWGFCGMVISDFNTQPDYMNAKQMAYAGGDLNLATHPVDWIDESSVADLVILMQCSQNILYTVTNSNAIYKPTKTLLPNGEIV